MTLEEHDRACREAHQRWADACCAANRTPEGPERDRAEAEADRLHDAMLRPAMILDGRPLFAPYGGTMR